MLCAQEGCLAKAVIVTACVLCSRFRSPREAEKMRLNKLLALMVFACWSTPCTSAAAQTQCVSFSDSIDGVNKDRTVEKSLKSLDAQIEKWKADSGVTGPVTVTAEKPEPHPFWRSSVPAYALLPPDVVSDSAYTICWTGVVSPVVCTSGARVCW